MILHALYKFYERLESTLPPLGFEEKAIPFIIVLNPQGQFVDLHANTTTDAKGKPTPRLMRVPRASGRSGAKACETAYCLWDHYGYVLAQPKLDKPDKAPSKKEIETAHKQHQTFKTKVALLADALPEDDGVQAVHRFLTSDAEKNKVQETASWQECLKIKGCNLSFRLVGCEYLVCQSKQVIDWLCHQPGAEDSQTGICLVTGVQTDILRLHGAVSGVAQKPSPLAAINDTAYCSYGKDKGFNFPVGAMAEFQYVTALNHLLRKASPTKFRIGDTSFVCFAEKATPLEVNMGFVLADAGEDPERSAECVKQLFASVHSGAYHGEDGKDTFYVLGLAPNSARIVIRFWKIGSVASFSEKLAQWFADLQIEGRDQHGYPGLKTLLRATALQYKDDNIPPNLAAEVMRSVLSGTPLPATLAQAVMRRIKAEQGYITPTRAALIKAWLNRKFRQFPQQGGMHVSLNKEDTRIGYCLGRLFAVLEHLQKSAQPGINATIRDRYYSSASCTPRTVFGTLMRMSTHHMKKLENPAWQVATDKNIIEIMAVIDHFPAHLNLENQGLFAIGYYHQKTLYIKKPLKENPHESGSSLRICSVIRC